MLCTTDSCHHQQKPWQRLRDFLLFSVMHITTTSEKANTTKDKMSFVFRTNGISPAPQGRFLCHDTMLHKCWLHKYEKSLKLWFCFSSESSIFYDFIMIFLRHSTLPESKKRWILYSYRIMHRVNCNWLVEREQTDTYLPLVSFRCCPSGVYLLGSLCFGSWDDFFRSECSLTHWFLWNTSGDFHNFISFQLLIPSSRESEIYDGIVLLVWTESLNLWWDHTGIRILVK